METDVLIVGGGIQGIELLRQLTEAGVRRVLLASAAPLGTGETLHSHGYLHRGYMMTAAGISVEPLVRELQAAADEWVPRLRPPYAPGPPVYHAIHADAVESRIELWNRLGLAFEEVSETPYPLRGGVLDRRDVRIFRIEDRLVSMRDILAELSAPLQDRILAGRVSDIRLDAAGSSVESCRLSTPNGEHHVTARVLILACGRGAQPLLRAAVTPSGQRPLEERCAGLNRIRFIPMLLVRGRHLPEVCGIFETRQLGVFTHPCGKDESMWIVTLAKDHEIQRGDFDASREQAPGTSVVAETVSRLHALVPEVRERADEELQFSFYFGGKTDHPDGGNGRYVDDCGIANLRLAWPGVWSLSWTNAREIVDGLRSFGEYADMFDPHREPLDMAAEGLVTGVPIGEELRLAASREWLHWSEWRP